MQLNENSINLKRVQMLYTIYVITKEKENLLLFKEAFALKNSETVYFTSIFSALSYSDIALIDNFDLIFFYFYFV